MPSHIAKLSITGALLTVLTLGSLFLYSAAYDDIWPGEPVFTMLWAIVLNSMVCGTWLAIWFREIEWNTVVVALAAVVAVVAATISLVVAVGFILIEIDYLDMWEYGAVIGPAIGSLCWLIGTALIWKETPGRRARRLSRHARLDIKCHACGYSLTGLTSTTCPECGRTYTLDEIISMTTVTAPLLQNE